MSSKVKGKDGRTDSGADKLLLLPQITPMWDDGNAGQFAGQFCSSAASTSVPPFPRVNFVTLHHIRAIS
jgi:hypothetical protein